MRIPTLVTVPSTGKPWAARGLRLRPSQTGGGYRVCLLLEGRCRVGVYGNWASGFVFNHVRIGWKSECSDTRPQGLHVKRTV